MSQSAEEFFSAMFSDHRSQESSSRSSGMGSFVDASKEFEDDDFVDLAEDFPERKTEIAGKSHITNDAVLVERSECVSDEILDNDDREQTTYNEGVHFLVTDKEPAITTTSIILEDKILQGSEQLQSVEKCNAGNIINEGGQILENNSIQIYEVEKPVAKINCKMEDQIENNSFLRMNNYCETEEGTLLMNIEADRSNERAESLNIITQPSVSFQNTMREGKNQLIIMKQTSQTMIKEFAEGKIDIPKMISENYEAEYTSKRVPSKTFNFIPPAKGLSGNYVDLGRLIAIGVLGLVCGVLSSIFTEITCNFASIEKSIGYSGNTSYMYFGLSKFSSMDSVFTGTKFCVPYHNNYYDMNGPSFARHAGELAILSGLCTMLILWYYIFTKRTTEICWKIGIYTSALASLFQISTYHFFLSEVCRNDTCLIGAGSIVSAIAAVSYALVAFGMIHNSPVRYMITVDKQGLLKNELNPDLV